MASHLPREERLHLMKFVCAFAWADLEIQDEERTLVSKMIESLELSEDRAKIEGWLRHPPAPEEVDPTDVPREHRELLLDLVRQLVAADDRIDPKEAETLAIFEQLLV